MDHQQLHEINVPEPEREIEPDGLTRCEKRCVFLGLSILGVILIVVAVAAVIRAQYWFDAAKLPAGQLVVSPECGIIGLTYTWTFFSAIYLIRNVWIAIDLIYHRSRI